MEPQQADGGSDTPSAPDERAYYIAEMRLFLVGDPPVRYNHAAPELARTWSDAVEAAQAVIDASPFEYVRTQYGSRRTDPGEASKKCECRRIESPEEREDLFIWRGDPTWWSCVSCDGRVRPLTAKEREAR